MNASFNCNFPNWLLQAAGHQTKFQNGGVWTAGDGIGTSCEELEYSSENGRDIIEFVHEEGYSEEIVYLNE